jgi:hypothetical protein
MRIPDFETLLPRLVATYEAGRLVPFIGSGMSRPICTDWPTFIGALERATTQSGADPLDSNTPRDVLIRRANSAVRTLKRRDRGAFAKAVRAGLLSNEPSSSSDGLKIQGKDASVYPSQTKSLARLWWPMVLSTNYDNCYAAAFHKQFTDRQLAVVGRSAEDCQRVLNSLSTAGRSLLWALQGYLHDVPCRNLRSAVTWGLEAQLVIGHEEYRRVTYRDLHFGVRLLKSFASVRCYFSEPVSRKLTSKSCLGRCWSITDRLRDPTTRLFRKARLIRTSCRRAFRSSLWNILRTSTRR